MKNQMTQSESLNIISEMIETAKSEISGSHFYFLFWGWTVLLAHFAHYILLKYTDVAHSEMVWFVCVIGGIVTWVYSSREKDKKGYTSHFEKVIGWVWVAYGITLTIMCTAAVSNGYSIYPIVTILTATPTFTTGLIIKHKPLIYCGSLFWIFGAISFTVSPLDQIIVGAIAITAGYLVPGYIMKNTKK